MTLELLVGIWFSLVLLSRKGRQLALGDFSAKKLVIKHFCS